MPTVEDYFDDETDLPLPSSSKPRGLPGAGLQGALLEEISEDMDMDYSKLADQGRGVFGENAVAPPPRTDNGKGKMVERSGDDTLRPSGAGGVGPGGLPKFDPNSPMGGFMGDMMKLQQAEDERLERLKKQFGNASIADPEVYKGWNTVYPIYFDAKVSLQDGRRVPRKNALWWPQANQIAKGCRTLGLPCVLEPDRTHPADWENPGRVKVRFSKDGKFINPIIKNRTQLYKHLSEQLKQSHPGLVYQPKPRPTSSDPNTTKPSTETSTASKSKGGKKTSSKTNNNKGVITHTYSTRPPKPTMIPPLDDRLPLHTPVVSTGVAVAAVKRDIETEKENKRNGITSGGASGAGEGGDGKEKMPKMKKVVIRKR